MVLICSGSWKLRQRIWSEVVAPSLIPVQPGKRIKTDRRDARQLVKLYSGDQLTMVHAPTREQEAVRDLVRCREDAKQDLMRARHRLSKLLLRRGQFYRQGVKAWTLRHEAWMSRIEWEQEADRKTFESYRLHLSQLQDRMRELGARIGAISQQEPYREPVSWLRCFRGIDTMTAMTIVTELHDVRRFQNARGLMAYLGLVPSENSSGDRVQRGGLTKAGNSHVRRVLIEASWCNRHKPAVGFRLRQRRVGQPARAIAHADRAVTVGTPVARDPRTDPYVPNYRIRILLWMMACRRCSGQGCRMRAGGSQASTILAIRSQVRRLFWLGAESSTSALQLACEGTHRLPVAWDGLVLVVASHDRPKPEPLLNEVMMHAFAQLCFALTSRSLAAITTYRRPTRHRRHAS